MNIKNFFAYVDSLPSWHDRIDVLKAHYHTATRELNMVRMDWQCDAEIMHMRRRKIDELRAAIYGLKDAVRDGKTLTEQDINVLLDITEEKEEA